MLATKAERDLILDMLSAGQINADQARMLFDAVERLSSERKSDGHNELQANFLDGINRSVERSFQNAADRIEMCVMDF